MTFHLLPERYALCRFAPTATLPDAVLAALETSALYSLTRSRNELSLTCEERCIASLRNETTLQSKESKEESKESAALEARIDEGWRALHLGVMDLSLTGIAARFTGALAAAGVAVNVIATFDTDYVFVKESTLDRALQALIDAGYEVVEAA
jgi:uncharacterized protein